MSFTAEKKWRNCLRRQQTSAKHWLQMQRSRSDAVLPTPLDVCCTSSGGSCTVGGESDAAASGGCKAVALESQSAPGSGQHCFCAAAAFCMTEQYTTTVTPATSLYRINKFRLRPRNPFRPLVRMLCSPNAHIPQTSISEPAHSICFAPH